MSTTKPKIAVTIGDAAGIGPELVALAAADGTLASHGNPVIVGDRRLLEHGMKLAGVGVDYTPVDTIEEAVAREGLVLLDTKSFDPTSVVPGKGEVAYGLESATNIKTAVDYIKQGYLEGICFGPNNKASMKAAGFTLHGAVDLLAGFYGHTGVHSELGVLGNCWTARISSHVPAREICDYITPENINNILHLLNGSMKLAGFAAPRIAVAGVNPHAGEKGTCGREEIDIIAPAIEYAVKEGINATGPYPADTLFSRLFAGDFDAVVSMYHDQGQIAMKLKGFDNGVTVMAGLPYPTTTCSHGTAYDIAGTGKARPGAFESAYITVCNMAASAREKGMRTSNLVE